MRQLIDTLRRFLAQLFLSWALAVQQDEIVDTIEEAMRDLRRGAA